MNKNFQFLFTAFGVRRIGVSVAFNGDVTCMNEKIAHGLTWCPHSLIKFGWGMLTNTDFLGGLR